MSVVSAVIDKSVFQRLCETKNSPHWDELFKQYQLVLPEILIEEVLVNVLDPRSKPLAEAPEMKSQLQRLQPCWMENTHEIAFREFVLGEKLTHLPPPSEQFLEKLFDLKNNDSELAIWLGERRKQKIQTVNQWKEVQQRILSANSPLQLTNESSFLREVICPYLRRLLDTQQEKNEFLYAVFGKTFARYSQHSQLIADSINNYSSRNLAHFHVTLICLTLRLCFFLGPVIQVQNGQKIIKTGNQLNSIEDEQYLAAAMLCQRLITGDKEMARLATAFKDVGLWKGTVIFIDRNKNLEDFFPAALV